MSQPTLSNYQPGSLIRLAQLVPAIVPVSPATLWRKVRAGTFPRPVKISSRVTAWRADEVRAWMESCRG
ncbi:helix-turn-helix transcriptional regulator [Paucibacter sp. M5-1]|uniref:helix-turn-helix transcriptional regulator n=1 Tax=Paucibacter sp. M5-1 TaxID=3015998 RepID=UPI0022B92E09|nr:AlpA family phage regulatory protein [Paucibacter sp. M5-1]MCZ7883782.1 AlpA family phage regulatory protein [Paucibacter sp. M5-1]